MQIAITGDVMLGRLVNSVLSKDRFTYVWGDTLDIFRRADLCLINLECVIASTGEKWNKTFKVFHFRAYPEAIDVLKTASIDYTSLANNHVLDFDIDALVEMLDSLKKNKIAYSGAGRNLKEAMNPAILKNLKNAKVGIVSITDNQPEWEATDHSAGINYIPITLPEVYENRLKRSIEEARNNSDIVIVSSHVGPHFRKTPAKEYVNFAHKIIDLGADIYWGHSNHMPQGIEIYKKANLIIYDAGDFIDDYAVDILHRNDLSFVFLLNFDDDDITKKRIMLKEIVLIPTIISDCKANTVSNQTADLVIKKMVMKCNQLGTRCFVDVERNIIKIWI
jgi:poly-gamma-glutamate capsule biosynthesis protein CapA/YwtB (metallophosphatase superfamily)